MGGLKSTAFTDVGFMRAGFGPFHTMLLLYTGTAWLADACEMILLSYVGPAVSHTKPLHSWRPVKSIILSQPT